MILDLYKVKSRISILHNIPKRFFKKIEASQHFGDHLFPEWSINVFNQTQLRAKFQAVYTAYKEVENVAERNLIINAFQNSNQIEKLCTNDPSVAMIVLTDLPTKVREPLDNLFHYLYNSATKHPGLENYTKTTLFASIDKFIAKHRTQVCPFCGLESFTNLAGQPRLPLDHWLNRDIFPMAAVNFNNLVPIGKDCNSNGVKGTKNVLIDRSVPNQRVIAYYPYHANHGVLTHFKYLNEPKIEGIEDDDWKFEFLLNDPGDQEIFTSWHSTFNISTRYKDYIKKNILTMWESEYKVFIDDHDILVHANELESFRNNLSHWRSSFNKRSRPGSLAFISFIDNLLVADEAYLTGLYQAFYSEFINSL